MEDARHRPGRAVGDGGGGAGALEEGRQREVLGVAVAGLVALDDPHAHAEGDAGPGPVDRAVLQPEVGADVVLEEEVGEVAAPGQGGRQGLADEPLGHAEAVEGGHPLFIRGIGAGRERCYRSGPCPPSPWTAPTCTTSTPARGRAPCSCSTPSRSTAAMWAPQVAALSARHRVIVPDYPGLGPEQPGPRRLHHGAAGGPACARCSPTSALERVAVAGLSMGGYLAFELWRQAPGPLPRPGALRHQGRRRHRRRGRPGARPSPGTPSTHGLALGGRPDGAEAAQALARSGGGEGGAPPRRRGDAGRRGGGAAGHGAPPRLDPHPRHHHLPHPGGGRRGGRAHPARRGGEDRRRRSAGRGWRASPGPATSPNLENPAAFTAALAGFVDGLPA